MASGFSTGGAPRIAMKRPKAKDFKKTMRSLFAHSKKYIPAMAISFLFAIGSTVLNIIGPGKISKITDVIMEGIQTGIDLDKLLTLGLTLAILYGVGFLFSFLQGQIMAGVTQGLSRSLRSKLFCKINRLPLKYFDGTTTGDVLSRITNDVDTVGQSLNQSLGSLVTGATMFFGVMLMMFVTNWIMALAGIIATMLGFSLMGGIIKKSQTYFAKQQKILGELNGHVDETYSGHLVVKAYNSEKAAIQIMHRLNDGLYDSAWKSQFMSGLMQPLMGFVGNLGYVAVCITGAVLVLNGTISFSVIVAFMLYIRLFTQPLGQLAQAAMSLQSAAAAGERVFEFLEEQELQDESAKTRSLPSVKGNVCFDHVQFGYMDNKTIIHDFSANVKAGQKIAIVGPTGAGKTTLVNLLMRFYELNSGSISIDGIPTTDLTRQNIHSLFSMVLQDTWLFEGTVRENIVYSKENVSDEQVVDACKAVGLHSFIKTLPQGYDTVLNDNATLSVGQRQLITIARAMVENAPMLILDEATSSVDTRTEVLIQQAMDNLMIGRTTFVIAHRLSTIKNADLILVMKDGDIIESGNHEELLKHDGFYADLYNSQFQKAPNSILGY